MKMPKLSSILVTLILVLFLIAIACMFLSQVIGEKAVVSDSVVLRSGSQKSFSVPPGYANVSVTSGKPINELYDGIGVSGEGHNIVEGSVGIGSITGANFTVINPGPDTANVNVRIATGTLNPFGYI